MSTNWVQDIQIMHARYEVKEHVKNMDSETLSKFLDFRIAFLEEELNELKESRNNPEEVVDACIDLCVVAIGTLDLFEVNAYSAWDEVLRANMNKVVGQKASRKNDLGLPDLIKPTQETHGYDWTPPDHTGNHGLLTKVVE